MLPGRYNQDIVNAFFKLMNDGDDNVSSGIDFESFIYYDFALRQFHLANATQKWALNEQEFSAVLSHRLFPSSISGEISKIPMTNFTDVNLI
jgi:hypothetical protein